MVKPRPSHPRAPGRSRLWQRGYSLAFVILVLAILGISLSAFFYAMTASSQTTSAMLNRRRAFYACDGVGRIFVQLGQRYLIEEEAPYTGEGLRAYICQQGGGCEAGNELPLIRPEGYRVTDFNVDTEDPTIGVIPNGAFEGMQARQGRVEFSIRGERDDVGFVCKTDQSVTLGQISMFQFFILSDGYGDWLNPAPQTANGRVHVNGDLCIAAWTDYLYVRRMTASGGIYHPGSTGSDCRFIWGANLPGAWISNDGSFNTDNEDSWTQLTSSRDATRSDWADYAIATWNGNVRDEAHGTQRLKVPISGTPRTQAGVNADYDVISNAQNSKFLVDPVTNLDTDDIAAQKLACKSDIRILNGVWYVRDLDGSPCGWPGTPIWSDHPGLVSRTNELGVTEVGQKNLYDLHNWNGASTDHRHIPEAFSYYMSDVKHEGVMQAPVSGVTPVISYGALKKVNSSPPRWEPGHWVNSNNDALCTDENENSGFYAISDPSYCADASQAVALPARILNAARSGFVDVQFYNEYEPSSDADERARVLPINFDIEAFTAAIGNEDPAELGSYFAGSGREFNGIVYISADWPGALDGIATNQLPKLAPVHGDRGDGAQLDAANQHAQRALPYPLCGSNTQPEMAVGHELTAGSAVFKIPSCASYVGNDDTQPVTTINARPNAVRLFNGRTLPSAVFPQGLTIATNLPVYVLGDMNATSDPSSNTATPWTPLLIAGDHITLMSNAWSDQKSGWHASLSSTWSSRDAIETTHHAAFLSGWVRSTSANFDGGFNNWAPYMEEWSGIPHHYWGSLVLGFESSYWRARFSYPHHDTNWSFSYRPPNRNWGFDPHFEYLDNQPPGAPLYDVSATVRWSR